MRVKSGIVTKRRHNKILKATKGYRMSKSKLYKVAHEAYMHAGRYAYQHRQKRAAQMRKVWIQRINAAARLNGTTYKDLMGNLKKNNILLDRKSLSEIAFNNPETFARIVSSL